jgi:RimJ/RimL family protein N-acetyltransferase
VLRPFVEDDFAASFAIRSREDVARYLYWGPQTEAQVHATLERRIAATSVRVEGDFLGLAVVLKGSNELIGDVDLQFVSEPHRQAEIGYVIHPDYQGRGYATEAIRPVLDLAFAELGVHRVVGRLEARNVASARVLEKVGMRREAHFVENEFVKGEWQSEIVYAILDREWRAVRG